MQQGQQEANRTIANANEQSQKIAVAAFEANIMDV